MADSQQTELFHVQELLYEDVKDKKGEVIGKRCYGIGGSFELPRAEALAAIQARTHKAFGHSIGVIPASLQAETKVSARRPARGEDEVPQE